MLDDLIELLVRGLDKSKQEKSAPSEYDRQRAQWEAQQAAERIREWQQSRQAAPPPAPPPLRPPVLKGCKHRPAEAPTVLAADDVLEAGDVVTAGASEAFATTSAATASSGRPAVGGSAASLAQWMSPATLRSQFILTEILKPPMCARGPRER